LFLSDLIISKVNYQEHKTNVFVQHQPKRFFLSLITQTTIASMNNIGFEKNYID